jgi:hypothetical protein
MIPMLFFFIWIALEKSFMQFHVPVSFFTKAAIIVFVSLLYQDILFFLDKAVWEDLGKK